MNVYEEKVTNDAKTAMGLIPEKLSNLEKLLQSEFLVKTPSQMEQSMEKACVSSLLSAVADQLNESIVLLNQLEKWVQLLIPRIEDGNNFGVEVQRAILQQLSTSKVALQTSWDSLTDYHWLRATALEKKKSHLTSVSTDKATTKTTDADGKEETKTTHTTTEKSPCVSQPPPAHEQEIDIYLKALDRKWYFNLMRITTNIQDHYLYANDVLNKNMKKLTLPRGTNDRAGMSMF